MDLKQFFDEVNHDVLISLISKRIEDNRILRLIRSVLQSGMMIGGVETVRTKGTPQGGPLSPLLSNILLNELDRELEKTGTPLLSVRRRLQYLLQNQTIR